MTREENNPWNMLNQWRPDFDRQVIVYMRHKKKDKHKYVLTRYLDHCQWEGIGWIDAHSRWEVVAWMYVPDFEEG